MKAVTPSEQTSQNVLNEMTHALERLTINEQDLLNQIKQILPWKTDQEILQALKELNWNYEQAIEYLIVTEPSTESENKHTTEREEVRIENQDDANDTSRRKKKTQETKIERERRKEGMTEVVSKKVLKCPVFL